MKKAFILLLCILAVFAIVSCKNEPKPQPEPEPEPVVENVVVTFNSQFGSEVAAKTVAKGAKVDKPEDPTKKDFVFGGWFKEATYENEFNFNDAVTEEITLFAKWTSEDPGVSMKTYKLTGVADNDRFQLRFKSSSGNPNTFLVDFKAGDVVSYQFRSTPVEGSVAVTKLRVRGASNYGGTSNFSSGIVMSEPDADGWITVTCTFAEGMDFTETGLLMDFRKESGNITAGDVLEIRNMKFNDQEINWAEGNTSAGPYEGCTPTLQILEPYFKYKLTATKGTDGVDDHKYDQDKFRLIWSPNTPVNPGDVVTVMFKAERKDELTAGRAFTYSIRDAKKWFSEKGKGDAEYPQFWSTYDDTASDGWIVASYVFPPADAATKETINYGETGATFVIDFRDTKIASPAEERIADVLYIKSVTLTQGETTTELVLDKATVATKYACPTVEEF